MKKIILIVLVVLMMGCALDRQMNITPDKTIYEACTPSSDSELIKGKWNGVLNGKLKRLAFDNVYNIITTGLNNKSIYILDNRRLSIKPYDNSNYSLYVFEITNLTKNNMTVSWDSGETITYCRVKI